MRIPKIVIENVYFEGEEEAVFIAKIRPEKRELHRCPICGRQGKLHDRSDRIKRWRSLDWGSTRVYIEANSPRIRCAEHGVITAKVPWARHDSDYTKDFETAVTWFTLHATAQDVAEYFRIVWRSVGAIVRRVQESLEESQPNRFDNLEEIGIDEISYKKGHKYMTVVVNHKTGALIWAKKGHGKEVLTAFFEELSEEQRAKIRLVSADGARWIADCIKVFCPNAQRCVDPFHVVGWATAALDEVRKRAVKEAKKEVQNTENKTEKKEKI